MHKKNIALYLLFPFFIQWIVTFLVEVVAINVLDEPSKYAVELTTLIALIILPIAGYIYKKDQEELNWEAKKEARVKDYIQVVVLGICSCIALNSMLLMFRVQELSSNYRDVAESIYQAPFWIQLVGTGIVAPAMEEMIYRGLLYRRMRSMVRRAPAIMISALLFGFNHGNLVQFLFASILGLLLAMLYEGYKRIEMSVLLHISINLTSLFMTWSGGFEQVLGGNLFVLMPITMAVSGYLIWKMLQKC